METKIIGFFGYGQSDLCIYLANILENMKYRVLVIDNSKEQKIKLCIPRPKEILHTITYQNVDYAFLRSSDEWKDYVYDYVLIDMGEEPEIEALTLSDFLVCVANCERAVIEKYQQAVAQIRKPVNIIFRNYCKNYMDQSRLRILLGSGNDFVVNYLFFPVSEVDECNRTLMQYQGYQGFSKVSKELERGLFFLCRFFSEKDYAEVLNGVCRAKRGECY